MSQVHGQVFTLFGEKYLFIIWCTIHKPANESQGIFLIKAFADRNIGYKKLNEQIIYCYYETKGFIFLSGVKQTAIRPNQKVPTVNEKWINTEILFSKTDKSVFLFGCEITRTIHNR